MCSQEVCSKSLINSCIDVYMYLSLYFIFFVVPKKKLLRSYYNKKSTASFCVISVAPIAHVSLSIVFTRGSTCFFISCFDNKFYFLYLYLYFHLYFYLYLYNWAITLSGFSDCPSSDYCAAFFCINLDTAKVALILTFSSCSASSISSPPPSSSP